LILQHPGLAIGDIPRYGPLYLPRDRLIVVPDIRVPIDQPFSRESSASPNLVVVTHVL